MKKGEKVSSYKQVFTRNFGIILVIYLVIAIAVTFWNAKTFRDETEQFIQECLGNVETIIGDKKGSAQEQLYTNQLSSKVLNEQELEMWYSGRMNRVINAYSAILDDSNSPKAKIDIAVYNEDARKWIAKSGTCLTFTRDEPLKTDSSIEADENLTEQFKEEIVNVYSTLYLERYLSQEQVEKIIGAFEDQNYYKGTFSVEGYYQDGEIIPTKLEQYAVTYDENDTRNILDRQLVDTFTFTPSVDTSKMVPFRGESDHLFIGRQSTSSDSQGEWHWSEHNKAMFSNIEKLIAEGFSETPNRLLGIFKTEINQLQKVDKGEETYWLSSHFVIYPLCEGVYYTFSVYMGGLIAVIILAFAFSTISFRSRKTKHQEQEKMGANH